MLKYDAVCWIRAYNYSRYVYNKLARVRDTVSVALRK